MEHVQAASGCYSPQLFVERISLDAVPLRGCRSWRASSDRVWIPVRGACVLAEDGQADGSLVDDTLAERIIEGQVDPVDRRAGTVRGDYMNLSQERAEGSTAGATQVKRVTLRNSTHAALQRRRRIQLMRAEAANLEIADTPLPDPEPPPS